MYTSTQHAKQVLESHKAFSLLKWAGLDIEAIAAHMFENSLSVETILIQKNVL